jgi:hypothetical protein
MPLALGARLSHVSVPACCSIWTDHPFQTSYDEVSLRQSAAFAIGRFLRRRRTRRAGGRCGRGSMLGTIIGGHTCTCTANAWRCRASRLCLPTHPSLFYPSLCWLPGISVPKLGRKQPYRKSIRHLHTVVGEEKVRREPSLSLFLERTYQVASTGFRSDVTQGIEPKWEKYVTIMTPLPTECGLLESLTVRRKPW